MGAFLADERPALVLFTGDPAQRPEAHDVAVVLHQLLQAHPMLRGAVVARSSEAELAPRLGVSVFPSLVLVRRGAPMGVVPRIASWASYREAVAVLTRGVV